MEANREQRRETEVTLLDVVRFFVRRWVTILVTLVATLLVTAAYLFLLVPERYQSSATLAISPTLLSRGLPGTRGMDFRDYIELVLADSIVEDVVADLRQQGVLEAGETLTPGQDLQRQIVPRGGNDPLGLLQLVAVAATPERAQATAGTWSRVFLDHIVELHAAHIEAMATPLRAQERAAAESLAELKQRQAAMVEEDGSRYAAIIAEWRERLGSVTESFDSQILAYQKETSSLMRASADDALTASELRGTQTDQDASATVSGYRRDNIYRELMRLTRLRATLANTPPLLTLRGLAITPPSLTLTPRETDTDAATAEQLLLEAASDAPVSRPIQAEQPNPVYQTLVEEAVDMEGRLLASIGDQMPAVMDAVTELAGLQEARTAGLARLLNDRASEISRITRQRDQSWSEYTARRAAEQNELERRIQAQSDEYSSVLKDLAQAERAANLHDLREVREIAAAGEVNNPVARRRPLKLAIALVLGLMLGIAAALILEVRATQADQP